MVDGGGLMLVPVPLIELPWPSPILSMVFVLLGGVSIEIMSFSVGDIKGNEMRKSRTGMGIYKSVCFEREKVELWFPIYFSSIVVQSRIEWAFDRTGGGLLFRVSNSDFLS